MIDEALGKAAGQVERASQILRRLRTFIRKGEPEFAPEDIAKLIEEGSAIALVGARERGITVRLQTAARLPAVLVDKIQIQQVIVNLMRNAVEAMEQSPCRELTLEAALAAEGGAVVVRIVDTGPGLAPDVANRLFQPFVTTKPQGMGVGLSICRSIVEGHGGTLVAEANPGGGTVFAFTLPLARVNAA
jgi:two-component system sensor kinase FixL